MCQISRSIIPSSRREAFAVHEDVVRFCVGNSLTINGRGIFADFRESDIKSIDELVRGDVNHGVE
jgi:hypothetical protein